MSTSSIIAIRYDLRLLGLTIGSICSRANVGMLYQWFSQNASNLGKHLTTYKSICQASVVLQLSVECFLALIALTLLTDYSVNQKHQAQQNATDGRAGYGHGDILNRLEFVLG